LFQGKTRVTHDPKHRECVDWIIARYHYCPAPIRHHNMPALPDDLKSSTLKCLHRLLMLNARQLAHQDASTSTTRVCLR